MTEIDPSVRWKLDKHIPVALIFAILIQSGMGLWWAATTSARVDALERDRSAAVLAVDVASRASAALSERLVKLETKFDGAIDILNEIKTNMRRTINP